MVWNKYYGKYFPLLFDFHQILRADGIINETIVKQRMLKDILEENHIKEVDFISLDVEGCELQILQGINFHKVKIKCLVIENVNSLEMMYKIRKYLTDRGYWLIARLTSDDVFVHRKYFYEK